MGETKALLPWNGKTLLEHQVTALSLAGATRIVVVLGHQAERLAGLLKGQASAEWVHNPDYRQGKTTSIKAGLGAIRRARENPPAPPEEEAILFLNVDQPRSPDIIRRIMELHWRGGDLRDRPCMITIPLHRDKGGHPVIVSTALMDELWDISEDTQGLKAVVHKHEENVQRVELDSPEILIDLNTPEDYQKALRAFSSR